MTLYRNFRCRLKLLTYFRNAADGKTEKIVFRSKFCNGNYFYELPILSDVVLDYRIVDIVWTFVESWHYSVCLSDVFVNIS